MDVKLIVIGGKHNGQVIPVRGPKFYIGRAEDCQLRPKSDLISRHHCAILMEDDILTVRDFGSKNGTRVNGENIYGEEDLENDDILTVGPLTFKVEVTVSLSGPKQPKVESIQEAAQRTVESASKKTADEDDIDIADWLAGEEDQEVTRARTKTNILDKDELAELLESETPSDDSDKEEKDKDKKGDKKEKKAPGRLNPSAKKPKTVDSQAAAEDTLRHFFHRR